MQTRWPIPALLLYALSHVTLLSAQTIPPPPAAFSRADTLRGMLTPLRTCYDVTYYHLDIKVDPAEKTIVGSNTIRFTVVTNFKRMQIDLAENMAIDRILFEGDALTFEREHGAVFVDLPRILATGEVHNLVVDYGGKPQVAQRPPWDGGLIWQRDRHGNP